MDLWNSQSLEAKKQRWRALWALEDIPRPLWFIPATPVLAMASDYLTKKRSVAGIFADRDIQLNRSLKFNTFFDFVQKFWSRDDFITHLQPQMGVGVFASAFGCKIDFPQDQFPRSHPLIKTGESAEIINQMKAPGIRDGQLGDILDFAEFFNKKAGKKYPIAITDLQGPMDTAYLVWNSCDFMMAMYDHPEETHRLMRLCTDLVIKFVKEFRSKVDEMVPSHFPPAYLPDGMGLTVSEDALAVLSPDLYEKFSLPYINELSEEFGGIVIHSCGNFEHQLDVLAKVKDLRGINFGVSETRFEAVWEKFGGKTVVMPHCSPDATIVANFKYTLEWIEHVLKTKTQNKGLCLMVYPVVDNSKGMAIDPAKGAGSAKNLLDLAKLGFDIRQLIRKYA